jgi:hypothetical protein
MIYAFKAPSIPRTPPKQTKNENGPNCKNCKYSSSVYGNKIECTLFKSLELIDDDFFNDYANVEYCRSEYSLCGPDGKYFKNK